MKPSISEPKVYFDEHGQPWIKPAISLSNGYPSIKVNGATVRIHRLACEAFHGPAPAGAVVRHLDDDSENGSPDNLAWGTQKQNYDDAVRNGRVVRGTSGTAKLTRRQARQIMRRRLLGESGKSLAREFGVSQATVCDIVSGRTWVGA